MMLISILTFILVLSILVIVHEFGHFVMARRAGILVEEFGFGIPPRILGKKVGETMYSINLFPFGGFVRLHGENTDDSVTNPKRAFLNMNKKVRVSVIVAGVVMNFLLAILAFSVVYSFSGVPRDTGQVKIVEVKEGSPAAESGIQVGDIVTAVDNNAVTNNEGFIKEIEKNKGKDVTLFVAKAEDQRMYTYSVVPRENPPEGEGSLGVLISSSEVYFPPVWQRPFYGIYNGFKEAFFWTGIVIAGFVKLVKDLGGGTVPQDLAGPVGIYALTTEASKFGILYLINFIGVLSVNLAILNVIPFPALDGGRLLFIAIEGIVGKRVLPKIESTIHTIGMVILIILIIAITAHDIQKLIVSGGINGYIESIVK